MNQSYNRTLKCYIERVDSEKKINNSAEAIQDAEFNEKKIWTVVLTGILKKCINIENLS